MTLRRLARPLSRMLLAPVAVLGAAFVLQSMPDLVRYLKMETM